MFVLCSTDVNYFENCIAYQIYKEYSGKHWLCEINNKRCLAVVLSCFALRSFSEGWSFGCAFILLSFAPPHLAFGRHLLRVIDSQLALRAVISPPRVGRHLWSSGFAVTGSH
jgi:hypothetical protein